MTNKTMKQIVDARDWDREVRATIENLAASGGGRLRLGNNNEVVVMSSSLWNLIEPRLPSLSEVLDEVRRDE